jgi:hypothetical protein
MTRTLAFVAVFVVASASAHGQTGVRYTLSQDSRLIQTHCLPPCACPWHQVVGQLSGTWTLTLVEQNPLFSTYSVTLVQWTATSPLAAKELRGTGTYRIGGEVAITQQLVLDLAIDADPVRRYDSGVVGMDPAHPFPQVWITAETEQFGCNQNAIEVHASPVACYPDCDGSAALNVNDFLCFMNAFAAADLYANCDSSSVVPILNANDFVCFLNRYAAGCP